MQPATSQPRVRGVAPAWWLLALSILYVVVQLPATGDLAVYHDDERFYTDGALAMLQTGDWTTAVTADGVSRFNKPLLTYWLIAGTFGSLGIGPTTSRLVSLLAGVLTAWLVWSVVRRVVPDEDVALVAGAITLAHLELGVLARRATPDMLLAGFVTLSLAGCLLLALGRERGAAAAWIGAGLGVATKGVPAVAAACFGLAAWGAGGAARTPARAVFRPRLIAPAAAVALAGTMLPFARHGWAALVGLYSDQLTVRGVESSVAAAVGNWLTYLGMTWIDLLPWSVLAVVAVVVAPSAVCTSLRQARWLAGYAFAWWFVLAVGLAVVDFTRPRYMAPSYPLLAAPAALVLVAAARQPAGARWLRRILRIAGLVVASLGMALVGLGGALDGRLALTGIVWMAGGALAAWTRAATGTAASVRGTLLGFAALAVLLAGTAQSFIHPVFAPAAEPPTAERLLALGPAGQHAVGIALPVGAAAKIRLASGGRLPLPELDATALEAPPAGRILVVRARAATMLERRGYRVERAGMAYDRIHPSDVLRSLVAPDREAWLAPRRRDLFIAVPPGVSPAPTSPRSLLPRRNSTRGPQARRPHPPAFSRSTTANRSPVS